MKLALLTLTAAACLMVIGFLPQSARADALDDEAAGIQQQIQVLQARLVYLQALKSAGYTSLPVATVAIPVTAGACSQAAAVGSCGANAATVGDSGAGRRQPVRGLLRRLFGRGGCGG